LGFLIGIAGAVALDAALISFDGLGGKPAGDPTDDGCIKSSKFMMSDCGVCARWSTDLLNCAIPLGADLGGAVAGVETAGGGFMSLGGLNLEENSNC
jgi:hypothetical protein